MRFLSLGGGLLAFAVACTPRAAVDERTAPRTAHPAAPVNPARFALVHVTVVDPGDGSEARDRAVVVEGDRIVAVVAAGELPAAPPVRAIEANGKYVIPGLWDMHVHFADPNSGKLFVASGVTGVRV